jgi:hypothetical protein
MNILDQTAVVRNPYSLLQGHKWVFIRGGFAGQLKSHILGAMDLSFEGMHSTREDQQAGRTAGS